MCNNDVRNAGTHKPSAYFVTCFALSNLFPFQPFSSKLGMSVSLTNLALLIANVEMVRFELMTPCLQGRCSPN